MVPLSIKIPIIIVESVSFKNVAPTPQKKGKGNNGILR
jgi:hypothetical protein